MKSLKYLSLACLVAFVLAACMPGLSGANSGSFTVTANAGALAARNIVPAGSMVVASYDLELRNALSVVVKTDVITGTRTYTGLLPGEYSLKLTARNDTTLAIGEGTSPVSIVGGANTPVTVNVVEYTGAGTLDVSVMWTAGVVAAPRVESDLSYSNGTAEAISWTLSTDSANYFNDTLSAGWYGLTMRLFDNGASQPSAGFATLARIAQNQVTSGAFTLTPNATTGSFTVDITNDFYTPLMLTSTVVAGTVTLYDLTAARTATVTGADVYVWYRDGVAIGNTDSFTFSPADYTVGDTHRVDVIGWSTDGKHAGQLTYTIIRNGIDPATVRISGTVNVNPAQFSLGSGMTVSLWSANGVTQIATQTTTNGGAYSFAAVPSGSYGLKVHASPGGSTDWSWFNSGQGKIQGATPAELIVIPQNGATVYDFLMGIGG